MSWIFLVIAGLFEVGFASSLGRAKETTGNEMYLWYTSFAICSKSVRFKLFSIATSNCSFSFCNNAY